MSRPSPMQRRVPTWKPHVLPTCRCVCGTRLIADGHSLEDRAEAHVRHVRSKAHRHWMLASRMPEEGLAELAGRLPMGFRRRPIDELVNEVVHGLSPKVEKLSPEAL